MSGAGGNAPERTTRFWSTLLWSLIVPRRRERIVPTAAGTLLIALSLGVGMAAYNAGNNILFITLALLLSCLVLSGVMSWLNFRGVSWRLAVAPTLRAGHEAPVRVNLLNRKRVLPTYGLWFDLAVRERPVGAPAKAESTLTGRGLDIRAMLAKAEAVEAHGRRFLTTRLDPGGEGEIEWSFTPVRRGRLRVELERVGSLFPFGFLRKSFAADAAVEVVVWPSAVAYQWLSGAGVRPSRGRERAVKAGGGGDLLALRRYAVGDSHRLMHWKASARTRQWLVRQFSAERADGLALRFETDAAVWSRAEQFELAVGLAAALAEDLFRMERLLGVALDGEAVRPVRRGADLEAWLDRLAVVAVRTEPAVASGRAGREQTIRLAPEGTRGVGAYVEDIRIAAA